MIKFASGANVLLSECGSVPRKVKRALGSEMFWAYETQENIWDIYLSEDVFFENIHAKTSFEAVSLAKSFINDYGCDTKNAIVDKQPPGYQDSILTRLFMELFCLVRKQGSDP
jgi:hypothetical protein